MADHNQSTLSIGEPMTSVGETRDIVLSADERYDIWEIKRAERPHLMEFESRTDDEWSDDCNGNNDDDSNDNDDDDDDDPSCRRPAAAVPPTPPPPLVDGCDLRGWRQSGMVKISTVTWGYLNVGSGCPLMRLESQLPVLSSRSLERWTSLRRKLLVPPARTARRIPEGEARNLPCYPWFERQNVPAILEGLASDWRASETCTFDRLVQDYGDHEWRFSDTHGRTMMLSTYRRYVTSLEGMSDDAPLAVYDSQLDRDDRRCLLDDYDVPECFAAPDLLECLGDHDDDDDGNHRPPFRWLLIGPARSGTGLHVDPLGTHAWVTLLEGAKRWVLFPYGTDGAAIGMEEPQIPSALWFADERDGGWYRRAMERIPGAVEVLQRPGETVYVPAGWPHLVLNLDLSTAITQNYATEYPSFRRISRAVQAEEPTMFGRWKERLQQKRSDLWDEQQSDGGQCTNTSYRYGTLNDTTPADGVSSTVGVSVAS
jgi:histone arginine demethylase JMJD6